jgi:hypothetical protein
VVTVTVQSSHDWPNDHNFAYRAVHWTDTLNADFGIIRHIEEVVFPLKVAVRTLQCLPASDVLGQFGNSLYYINSACYRSRTVQGGANRELVPNRQEK